MKTEAVTVSSPIAFKSRLADYVQLAKLRLSLLVVFSASMSYLWATNRHVDVLTVWLLSAGGFLITAASNAFNQVIERESDKLMKRTFMRPLPCGRISVKEAMIAAGISAVGGLVLLLSINLLSALLGALAMALYVGVYTPLKKVTFLTIIPGSIAGSLPVIIGYSAATGVISRDAVLLFLIQFAWQFPHTWSIAWLLNDEYRKAGIKLLPFSGKNTTAAVLIMASTFMIIPAVFLLRMYESAGIHVTWLLALAALALIGSSYKLFRNRTDRSAVRLMLGCFAFLPFVLIVLVIERFL